MLQSLRGVWQNVSRTWMILSNGVNNLMPKPDNHIDAKLDEIIGRLNLLTNYILDKEKHMATTLNDLVDLVSAQSTVESAVVTLLETLSADLNAALASGADPVLLQSIADGIAQNTANLSAAVVANTPAA